MVSILEASRQPVEWDPIHVLLAVRGGGLKRSHISLAVTEGNIWRIERGVRSNEPYNRPTTLRLGCHVEKATGLQVCAQIGAGTVEIFAIFQQFQRTVVVRPQALEEGNLPGR
jgi:hypothetical protein